MVPSKYSPLGTATLGANQVLINGIQIIVDWCDGLNNDLAFCHDAIEQQIEFVCPACSDKKSSQVLMQPGFDNMVLRKNFGRQLAGMIAANQNLHRVLFHLVADAMDVSFRHDIAVIEQDDEVRHHVHFVQDVTRNNQVHPFRGQFSEQSDDLSPHHRIKSIQGFIENQN